MTDNNQQIDTMENTASNPKLSGKRRQLVKGALGAVPVVLTLRSGAAFAAASTGSCISRDNRHAGNTTPPVLTNSPGADTWVRKQVFCRTLTPVDRITGTRIGPSFKVYNENRDAKADWVLESKKPDDTVFKTYKEGSGSSRGFMVEFGVPTSDIITHSYTPSATCYILVHIDPYTDLSNTDNFKIGDSEPLNGDRPNIMGSCWTSVDPNGMGPNPIL